MNIKHLATLAAALLVGVSLLAQEQTGRIKPVRFSAAVTAGANGYAGIKAMDGTAGLYQMEALSADWTDKMPAFGAEFSLLFCDKWKLDAGGMFNFSYNPGYIGVPGSAYGREYKLGDVPDYRAVAAQQSASYMVYLGCSYYFRIEKIPALRPYLGARFTGSYANNFSKYDEEESMGISSAETFGLGASCVGGIDYYLASNFFIGASVDLVRYVYGATSYRPQDGLPLLAGDTHNIGALAAPRVKIGFLF